MRDVLDDLKVELKEFVSTRIEMLKTELNEKLTRIKAAVPMLAGAALFALGAFFALTFGLIALIAAAFPDSPWGWVIGAACIFVLYALIGGIAAFMGYKEISTEGLAPQRTLRVLKQDQVWLQNEARSA
jgi:uncharacterized membrane protein YqjE